MVDIVSLCDFSSSQHKVYSVLFFLAPYRTHSNPFEFEEWPAQTIVIVSYLEQVGYTWLGTWKIPVEWVELKVQLVKVGSHSFLFEYVEIWVVEQKYDGQVEQVERLNIKPELSQVEQE